MTRARNLWRREYVEKVPREENCLRTADEWVFGIYLSESSSFMEWGFIEDSSSFPLLGVKYYCQYPNLWYHLSIHKKRYCFCAFAVAVTTLAGSTWQSVKSKKVLGATRWPGWHAPPSDRIFLIIFSENCLSLEAYNIMKFSTLAFASLVVSVASQGDEINRIDGTFGSPRQAPSALTGCQYKALDIETLIEKVRRYHLLSQHDNTK